MIALDNRKCPTNAVIEIYLADIHGEYPLPDPETIVRDPHPNSKKGFPVHIKLVWDTFEMERLIHGYGPHNGDVPKVIEDAYKTLPEGIANGEDPGHVWLISGTLPQIIDVWERFLFKTRGKRTRYNKPLLDGPTGADDDTFDYWPNAMDMALALSQDLDTLTKTKKYTTRFLAAFAALVKNSDEGYYDDVWTPPNFDVAKYKNVKPNKKGRKGCM